MATDGGEQRGDEAADPAEAPREAVGGDGRIPPPAPEEAPELLGERSDYPLPFGEEDGGGPAPRGPGAA